MRIGQNEAHIMKIALCLVGELRGFEYCFDTIRLAFPKAEIDVYSFLWERDKKILENDKFLHIIENAKCKLVKCTVNSDNSFSDNALEKKLITNFGGLKRGPGIGILQPNIFSIRVINISCYTYSLITDKKSYDFIINARYDLKYFFDIESKISSIDDRTLFTTTTNQKRKHKELIYVWDGFCGGTVKGMSTYYEVDNWMKEYYNTQNGKLTDERMLFVYLNSKNMNILRIPGCVAMQHNKELWYNHTNISDKNIQHKLKTQKLEKYNFMYVDFLKREHPELFQQEYDKLELSKFEL